MPLCRDCNQPIEHLNVVECQYVVFKKDADLDIVGNPGVIRNLGVIRSTEVVHWECPLCEEALFWRYEDTLAYLAKGIDCFSTTNEAYQQRGVTEEKAFDFSDVEQRLIKAIRELIENR